MAWFHQAREGESVIRLAHAHLTKPVKRQDLNLALERYFLGSDAAETTDAAKIQIASGFST